MPKQLLHNGAGLAVLLFVFSSVAPAQNNSKFVFTNVNIIPMNHEVVISNQNVLVEDGRIKEIGLSASMQIPEGATVIDGAGKYLIPSLSDMHVHLEGDAWNIMFPPEKKFTKEEMYFEDLLFLYVARGITTIDVLSALPEHIELREKIKKNELIGPRLILSRMIDGAGQAWPPPICTWINTADEAAEAVIDIQRQGYDRVKVYSFLGKGAYDSIMATSKRINIPVDGHVPMSTSVEYVLASGQGMIAHSEEIMKFTNDYSAEQVDYFSSICAKSNVWVVSSLVLNKNINSLLLRHDEEFSKAGLEYLHPMGWGIWNFIYDSLYNPIPEKYRAAMRDGYEHFQKPFVFQLHKKGGKLLIGTDTFVPSTLPAISLHEELEELVIAGLTPYEALKASTTNTFEFLNELNSAGTIEVGKAANLILLDENPLTNISNTKKIAGVMTQTRWLEKNEIDSRLEKIRNKYSELKEKKK